MRLKLIALSYILLLFMLLTACQHETESSIYSVDEMTTPSPSATPEAPEPDKHYKIHLANEGQKTERLNVVDLSSYFGEYSGTAIFLDAQGNYTVYNKTESETRVSPRSTFKIISTLAALEYGIVTPEQSIIEWDGTNWRVDSWNHDSTMEEAFQNSSVWYYRKLIDKIGKENMANFLEKIQYGNKDISQWEGSGLNGNPKIDGFWLESSLLISPKEQVDIISKIFESKVEISKSNVDKLKIIMHTEYKKSDYNLYGKTGTGKGGCYVGFFEVDGHNTYFAVYLNEQEESNGSIAQEIACNIIDDFDVIEGIEKINK